VTPVPSRTAPLSRDGGFVTVAVASLLVVLVGLAGVAPSLGAVEVARHRAAAAADLTALAGARHRLDGQGPACAAASEVDRAQGAELEGCELDGQAVTVQAGVRPLGPVGRFGVAHARARAGPMDPRP